MDLAAALKRETEVWEALRRGDGEADARLLADDFLGVYSVGFAGKALHVAQLANGPTVDEYRILDARLITLSDDHVLLCYRAEWRVPGAASDAFDSMYVSSLWSRRDGAWLNVFSQDCMASDAGGMQHP
jgi:hypothetical protein